MHFFYEVANGPSVLSKWASIVNSVSELLQALLTVKIMRWNN